MKFDLKPVPKARNLDRIGWNNGYLLVQFKGRAQQYVFGPEIDAGELDKILKNPFPDALFHKVIKERYRCHKVGS